MGAGRMESCPTSHIFFCRKLTRVSQCLWWWNRKVTCYQITLCLLWLKGSNLWSGPVYKLHWRKGTVITSKVNSGPVPVIYFRNPPVLFHLPLPPDKNWVKGSTATVRRLFGGDNYSAFFRLGQRLDGLVECDREKGSKVEACMAEWEFFMREQRQLERHSTRKRPDIGNVLDYLEQQNWFQSRHHLYRVCSVITWVDHRFGPWTLLFVSGVSASSFVCTVPCRETPEIFFKSGTLPSNVGQLNRQLAVSWVLYGFRCLHSVISFWTMELVCCRLPWLLVQLSARSHYTSPGHVCCLRDMRTLRATGTKRTMLMW